MYTYMYIYIPVNPRTRIEIKTAGLHAAFCMLHAAFCMLHAVSCMLHASRPMLRAACFMVPGDSRRLEEGPGGARRLQEERTERREAPGEQK